MKTKYILNLCLVAFYLSFMTGCLVTRQQVRENIKSEPLTPEQQRKSSEEVRYQEMDETVRQMNGRIETLENSMNMLNADKSGTQVERQNEKKNLDERFKIFEEAIAKLEAQNLALSQKVEALQVTIEARNTKSSREEAKGTRNSFDVANEEFADKQWKEAIVSFEKYRSLNPKGKKYPEATYKIAASFHELGMKTEAKAFYAEVVEKFPKSDWAQKAKQAIKAIK